MSLTKEQRDNLPASDFAVPHKRALPMHDKVHTRMAWNMLDRTQGLSSEEKKIAKDRILHRAHELGVDTQDWHAKEEKKEEMKEEENTQTNDESNQESDEIKANICFSAMSLDMPDIKDHPNQIKFKGVLTKLDEPSDSPLSGSKGKRVMLPKDVAEKALPTLLSMAVDFTPDLDGHDVKSKIGVITEADIVGNEIHIAGFFYGADFPDEVKRIQAEKAFLGFSYEAQTQIRSLDDDPLVVKNCIFTGAAVLYKDKAAYTSTSLSAKMEKQTMSEDTNVMKIIEDLQKKISVLEDAQKKDMKDDTQMNAGNIQHLIKPHAEAMRECASKMAAAGIGMHAKLGHVAVLHHMADNMEAEAAMGKMPHIYYTSDFMHASSEKKEKVSSEIVEMKESMKEIKTMLTDLDNKKFAAASAPERKTLSPAMTALLAKAGIGSSESSEKLSVREVDNMLSKTNMSIQQRVTAKLALTESGRL